MSVSRRVVIGSAIGAGVLGGSILAGTLVARARKKRRSRARSPRKKHSSSKKKRGRRTPHTAGKRRDTSHRRIRYTKNGQPYVIMASGKARFIKKSGAKRSRSRPGGRY